MAAAASDILLYHPRHADLDPSSKELLFEPDKLKQAGLITRELVGRGTTYFYTLNEHSFVLRHYWRGGWIRHWLKDSYFWLGLENTRSLREWKLLETMEAKGLPVPVRVGLRIQRRGLFYRSDIVTEELEKVESLAQILLHRPAAPNEWSLVGETVRRFHDQQIHHRDLNAHNLLLRTGSCYLIDFDRGRVDKGDGWKGAVLARLRRSLDKLQRIHSSFHFREEDWTRFMKAYG